MTTCTRPAVVFLIALLTGLQLSSSQQEEAGAGAAAESSAPAVPTSFYELPSCSLSSLELSQAGADTVVDPCVLYDIGSDYDYAASGGVVEEVAIVQVSPSLCQNHRDGAVTGVEALNSENGGRGLAIGYNKDHYVRFRLISLVGGVPDNIGTDEYKERHVAVLDSVLESVPNAFYILGSCSFNSALEKDVASKHETILMAQVGPPGFYRNEDNPYVFGIHVNSDTYPLPALQSLRFNLNTEGIKPEDQPVRVIYRDKSEFFYSTCRSVIDAAVGGGFDVLPIEYDPDGDEDGNGLANKDDVAFLEGLADQACPKGSSQESSPALFACVLLDTEADTILARFRANGCRPSLTWFTTATWGWAGKNMDTIPYFQGGGQWHKNFAYSDRFFESGQAVLDYGESMFGYSGSYDHVVSYAMPLLFSEHIASVFRVVDEPNVSFAFSEDYETMRRSLLTLNADTIFGPVSFNDDRRNVGRGAAGTQWIPKSASSNYDTVAADDGGYESMSGGGGGEASDDFVLGCVSPLTQAEASTIVPAPSAHNCDAGMFISEEFVRNDTALLATKCDLCPANTYTDTANRDTQCQVCPGGSTTRGEIGSTQCVEIRSNLIDPGLKIMGYAFVAISWSMSLGFLLWLWKYKKDPVVRIGQIEFLILICIGAFMSTASILPLSFAEADVGEELTTELVKLIVFAFFRIFDIWPSATAPSITSTTFL